MKALDKALLKTGIIDKDEYAARELYRELSHGGDLGSDYSNTMKILAGLGIGAVGSVATPAIVQNAYAEEAQAAEKAEAHAAYGDKKIRILVKPFEVTGEQVKRRNVGTISYSGGDEGFVIRDAIIDELIKGEKRGSFNSSGRYLLVEDTDKPDNLEADLVVNGTFYRSGNRIYFYTRLVDTKTGRILYTDKFNLHDEPVMVPNGGSFIGGALDNYLD